MEYVVGGLIGLVIGVAIAWAVVSNRERGKLSVEQVAKAEAG